MARRFSPEFNKQAQRIVKSARQRIRRAEQRGMKNLPEIPTLRQLKARNQTQTDLKKELAYLRKLNTDKDALQRHFLGEGAIINWEFNYIKDNLKDVKVFYDVQIKMARARVKADPHDYGLKQQLATLEDRRNYLNRDINNLSYSGLKTFRKYLSGYKNYTRRDINYYDKYLKSLDMLMKQSGVDSDTIKRIRDKVAKMPRQVFIEMYRRHDVVDELFQIDPSPDKPEHAEDLLSPEDRAIYERQEAERHARFDQNILTEDDISNINEKASAIEQKLDQWQVESIAGLHNRKKLKLSSEEEEEMFDKIYGDMDW